MILSGIRNITFYLNDIKCEFCFHLETSALITLASSPTQLTLWDVQRPRGSHREKHMASPPSFDLIYELLLICLLCNLPLKTENFAALGPPWGQGHCCSRTLKTVFSRFCYCWEVQSHSNSRTFVGGFFFLFFSGTLIISSLPSTCWNSAIIWLGMCLFSPTELRIWWILSVWQLISFSSGK